MIVALALSWTPVSVVFALLIGQAARLADRREPPAQRDMDLAA